MKRILIIEDDECILETLITYLCETHNCDSANSFDDAAIKIELNDYDLILVDLVLGSKLATPLIDAIRLKTRQPVIVAMSAMTGLEKLLTDKVDDYLKKPFSLESLDKILH